MDCLLNKDYYRDYCDRFNGVWEWLSSLSYNKEAVSEEICEFRNYTSDYMYEGLISAGFIKVPSETDLSKLSNNAFKDLGLINSEGNFLLSGRYTFPVRDMVGNVIALIGWYPDEKKYITTPSVLFSKSGMFFGMEQLSETGINDKYFLVEGIFDCLSLRALGFNCVAQMGSSSSLHKEVLYGLFKRIVAVPDADGTGRKVVESDLWHVPYGSSYMNWSQKSGKGGKKKKFIKDVDDFCKYYDKETLVDLFSDVLLDDERIISFEI